MCCRVSVPNAGSSHSNVRAHTGPTPWALCHRSSFSRHQGAGPEHRLEVVVQRGDGRIEPRHRGNKSLRKALACPRQAVLCCGPHDDQWLAAPQKGTQLLRLGVGQRSGCRADHVGTVGQGAGIQRLRFRQLARGPGTIAGLPRVDHDDREAAAAKALVTSAPGPRWLPAPSGWGGGSAPGPRASPPRWHHWRRPSAPQRGARQCPTGLWPRQSPDNTGPALLRTPVRPTWRDGLNGTRHGTGSGSPARDDPRSAPVSVDQGSIGLSRPGTA